MSAIPGNKYAEKWTLEKTLLVLSHIESYSYSNDCLYLGHALSLAHCYNDVWAYWKRKWKRQPEIISKMKGIMQRFEVRLFEKMAKKEIPHQVAMFALKHHYGWGKEPKSDEPFVDLSDEDKELIPEPKPEKATPQSTEKEERPTGMAINRYMLNKYNSEHPTAPILPPAAFFDGKAPEGLPAILYEDGYFLRA